MNVVFRSISSRFVVTSLKRFKSSMAGADVQMKVFTQKRNPITGNTEWDMQHEDYDYHQEIARSAFADMLHDTERNKKYYLAIQMAVNKMHKAGKKANVLDIGAGTGLLSIMAVRCGADSVVACEAFKPIADCCLKILEKNGVADKVTVIPKRSTSMTVGKNGDMKEKANILVTEVFDTELIGEGALTTFNHAHSALLEKGCIVVPDSAVMYAQVIECPTLQRYNKLNDLDDEDLHVVLRTPPKMKNCPGSAAVHDIQLSQLARHLFIEIAPETPVFCFDFSGRTSLKMKRQYRYDFSTDCNDEETQVVFMWWELNMDTGGKIVLSCAPWWSHPEVNMSSKRPIDSIQWRDHWMQAIYYLPRPLKVNAYSDLTLICCHDEFSLWFYIEDEIQKFRRYQRPVCDCGVHMSFSRTHIAYLNDGRRSKKLMSHIKHELGEVRDPIVLDLNGSSFMGLAAAKMGAKKVYILERMNLNLGILRDYMEENRINNVEFIAELTDEVLKEVTNIICDPNFSSSVMPWENLKLAYLLYQSKDKLRPGVSIIPEGCQFWAMPVEFQHLQKIRMPIGVCEGIDMGPFDELVENSRSISDAELEAHPLWEYHTTCRGLPQRMLDIDLRSLQPTYANSQEHALAEPGRGQLAINGFVVWAVWVVGEKGLSTGPLDCPELGQPVPFDPCSRQAVKILKHRHLKGSSDMWNYQVTCDLEKGHFNVSLDLSPPKSAAAAAE